MLQPRAGDWVVGSLGRWALKTEASQSRSSGCVGLMPERPKSLGVRTIPRPKWCCQTRFTITRATSGFRGETIQLASRVLRPVDLLPEGGWTFTGEPPPAQIGYPGWT